MEIPERSLAASALLLVLASCSEAPVEPEPDPEAPTLRTNAAVSFAVVYQSGTYSELGLAAREWIPVDVSASPMGELWVVQRMRRDERFDDLSECASDSQRGAPNDCAGLQGGTVALREPTSSGPATAENGRATVIVDANAWHFMRRPSAIAFGATELRIEPDDPGAVDPITRQPVLTEAVVYTNTFATCHEHFTGNFTDQDAFIGPTLWTADPAIYNGVNGEYEWSNGAHLDMLHATSYCMGIAHDGAAVYWAFNGELGTLDRYDFVIPHVPGHHFHEDGIVRRYDFDGDALSRLPNVPSNMAIAGRHLYIADTGNGRVVRFDREAPMSATTTFRTHELIEGEVMGDAELEVVVEADALAELWGERVEPSGLALLDDETLVVASHGSGHLTLMGLDGAHVRTIDTELGEGIGGLAVMDGVIYFAHMGARRVYRLDVDPTSTAD